MNTPPFNVIEAFTRMVNGVASTHWHFRCLHRHGFGIQSPWAFDFVRNVLFESLPYYVFDHLQGTPADKQLYRIALATAPHPLMLVGVSRKGREYLRAAHAESRVVNLDFGRLTLHTCLVVDGIDGQNRRLWQQILALPQTTTSFSARKRGIAFFDPARQRQNYYI